MQRIIILIGVLAIATLTVFLYSGQTPSTTAETSGQTSFADLARGNMSAVTIHESPEPIMDMPLILEDGTSIQLSSLQGKVLLVNLWASWCAPCQAEMAHLNEVQVKLGGDDFEVVAINNDLEGVEKARETLVEWSVPDLAVYADPKMKSGMEMAGGKLPTTFLVDRKGMVRATYLGPLDWASDEAYELYEALINEAS